jgi:hypothetical protein
MKAGQLGKGLQPARARRWRRNLGEKEARALSTLSYSSFFIANMKVARGWLEGGRDEELMWSLALRRRLRRVALSRKSERVVQPDSSQFLGSETTSLHPLCDLHLAMPCLPAPWTVDKLHSDFAG